MKNKTLQDVEEFIYLKSKIIRMGKHDRIWSRLVQMETVLKKLKPHFNLCCIST